MKTVVYINNDRIQIIFGYLTKKGVIIKRQHYVQLEEGTILNGVIIDRDELLEKLITLKNKVNNVTILIDSSNISVKRIVTPKLKKNQMRNIVKNEFGFSLEDGSFLYDENIYPEKKQNVVICCATSKSLIDSYISVFREAKIRIKKVDVAVSSIVKFISFNQKFENKTFVLNIVSNNNMLSVLFENGNFLLTNRNRLFAEEDSVEYVEEIFSKLSSMIQFNKSQKSDFEIKTSYYLGLNSETISEISLHSNKGGNEIEIEEFEEFAQNSDANYFFPLTALLENKKDINLYKASLAVEPSIISFNKKFNSLVACLLICIAVMGVYTKMAYDNGQLQEDIDRYNDVLLELDYDNILTQHRDIFMVRQEQLENILGITMALEYINTVNNFTKAKILTIDNALANKIKLEALSYDGSSITLAGMSNGELESAKFVHRLKETQLFTDVLYTGYSLDSFSADGDESPFVSTENYAGEFQFSVVATLKAGI